MKRQEAKTNRLIGQRLREARLACGLSLVEAGRAVGVAYQSIQKYESGKMAIPAARILVLAELFDTPIEYFFEVGKTPRQEPLGSRYRLMLMMRKLRALERSDAARFEAIRELIGPLING